MTFDCDAVLFDMDGTLVDSTVCVEAMWRRWAARHNLDAEAILAVSHGRRTIDTLAEVAPHLDVASEAAHFEAEELEEKEGVVAVAGAAAILGELLPEEWAVVTSASQELAARRLRLCGLPAPEVLVGAEDVRRGKPDAEGYLTAARKLGVLPGHCLVIEDTPSGIDAGRAGGMQVLGITTTYGAEVLRDAVCIADFRRVRIVKALPGVGHRLQLQIG